MNRVITTFAAALFAILAFAPAAHADDDSFLAAARFGVSPLVSNEQTVALGHQACSMMRAGTTAEHLKNINAANGPVVDAAQHELCPDTLG